jgi:Peptidase family M23
MCADTIAPRGIAEGHAGSVPSIPTEPSAPRLRPRRRARRHTTRPERFSLLIVRGDGTRVFRCNVPRASAVAAGIAIAVVGVSITGLITDYVRGRHMVRQAAAVHRELAEQREVIQSFNRRVVDLRREVGGWREFHARIWAPFGPDAAHGRRDAGVGGGTASTEEVAPTSPIGELDRLTETVMREGESLRALDRVMTRAGKVLTGLPSRWPIRGAVNSEFGNRQDPWTKAPEFHAGLDIQADSGTAVRAPAAGTVVVAGRYAEYGNAVIIDHGQDIKTLYGHLSKFVATPGQTVERGTVIAYSGNTGRSSGPHLHYEILIKGKAVNPRAYLWD